MHTFFWYWEDNLAPFSSRESQMCILSKNLARSIRSLVTHEDLDWMGEFFSGSLNCSHGFAFTVLAQYLPWELRWKLKCEGPRALRSVSSGWEIPNGDLHVPFSCSPRVWLVSVWMLITCHLDLVSVVSSAIFLPRGMPTLSSPYSCHTDRKCLVCKGFFISML